MTKNLEKIRSKIGTAKLLVVTKKRPVQDIRDVIAAGAKDIGENTLQEIEEKYDPDLFGELEKNGVRLHFIGHLQSNKIKKIVQACDVIHSIDSLEKAEKVNQAAGEFKKLMPVYIELNLTGEEQKHGIPVADLQNMFQSIQRLPNLKLIGFMCMGKHGDPEETRRVFRRCKELSVQFRLPETSMGMSEDYQIAVEEGSTMVRLGRVVFELAL